MTLGPSETRLTCADMACEQAPDDRAASEMAEREVGVGTCLDIKEREAGDGRGSPPPPCLSPHPFPSFFFTLSFRPIHHQRICSQPSAECARETRQCRERGVTRKQTG